jgi:hypothetical protein
MFVNDKFTHSSALSRAGALLLIYTADYLGPCGSGGAFMQEAQRVF